MLNKILQKKGNAIFICQITENLIKVIKCISKRREKKEISGLEIEYLSPDSDDKKIKEKLRRILQVLGYANNPIILSLPRSQVTCRNLRIPSTSAQEIDRISTLQASHYLPYSSEELITSYQLIQVDKEGYSNIILVVAQKDVIIRYINILKDFKPAKVRIIPSSNGIAHLYSYVTPNDLGPVMIVDIDSELIELTIVKGEKLFFSRSFRLTNNIDWENLFVNEIRKTKDAYLKEAFKEPIRKIIFVGPDKMTARCKQAIDKQGDMESEILTYSSVSFAKNIIDKLNNSENSFAGLIGLGLKETTASLNLLPREIKEKENKSLQLKEYAQIGLLIAGIILIWMIAITKNIDNKEKYLQRIRLELAKVSKEAKPLEDIEKKLKLLENKGQNKSSSLDLLHDLYGVMPNDVSLTNLNYEEDSKVILRGQAAEFNSVLAFVSNLEKSERFKKFNIKMKYATQKKTQAGEAVSFEINCIKK